MRTDFLCPWILCRITYSLRLVVSDVLYAKELEYFEESLTEVTECNGTVVRESLSDKNATTVTTITECVR